MKRILKIAAISLAALVLISFVGMKATGISPLPFQMHTPRQQSDGIAIGGYDVVSYFTSDMPLKGDPQHAMEWEGVTWHFSTAANLDLFRAAPQKYAPQYGGYCSRAVSTGFAAHSLPDSYTIHDGKLYFFHDPEVKAEAMKDLEGMITKCEQEWP